jgi:hypothetical protein
MMAGSVVWEKNIQRQKRERKGRDVCAMFAMES